MKLIALGNSPVASVLYDHFKDNPYVCIYPCFFDDKKDLIQRKWNNYIRKLWQNKDAIDYALWPDYMYFIVTLPSEIKYIFPVHYLSEIDRVKSGIAKKYTVIFGYASDRKLRDYTLDEFLTATKGYERWYLGASSKTELREAFLNGFDYVDITTMALGPFRRIKDVKYVVTEIKKIVSSYVLKKQVPLF